MRVYSGLVIAGLLLISNVATAQDINVVKPPASMKSSIEGPESGKVGTAIWLTFKGTLGADPQFACSPSNNDWKALKTLDGELVIIFTPTKDATYTFIVASNKENKTLLDAKTIVIGVGPTPVIPVPDEEAKKPGKYEDRLKAAYMVSPDSDNLKLLIKSLNDTKASSYTTLADAAKDLKAKTTADGLGDSSSPILRKVRDEIKSIIVEEFGEDGSKPFNAASYKKTLDEIVKSLKKL